jgi:hypothetical protein
MNDHTIKPAGDEQALFEDALHASDSLLLDSLRRDERRRRRRRIVLFTLFLGGIAMITTTMAMLAGWLTIAAPPPQPVPPDVPAEQELNDAVPGRIVDTVRVTKDLMILSYLPDWGYGNVDNVGVANNGGGVRALYRWESVPANLIAEQNRRVYLAVYSRETTAGPEAGEIAIHPLSEDWAELSAWRDQPKIDPVAEPVVVPFVAESGWKLFDVTSIVRRPTTQSDFGVVLKFKDESRESHAGQWSGYALVSREAVGDWQSRRPRLLVVEPSDGGSSGD